jgi:competence protein ComEC
VFELVGKFKTGWVIIFILVLNLFLWNGIANAPDGNLHINVLDVGSGSGVLIQTPEGRYILINGGGSSSKVSDGVGRILPLFQQKIDSLIITSCEAEEIEGLAYAVEGFLPENVLWTCNRSANRASRYLDEALSELNVADIELRKGDTIELGQGANIEVVATSDEGAYLIISMGSFRMIIVDNVGIDDHSFHQVNVMLAGQGELEVITENLLSTVNPQLIILSLGAGDKQNRPDGEVIDLLAGHSLLRTDDSGWIKVSTDGESMWVDIEKN